LRGLAASATTGAVTLVAVTADASANRILSFVDDGRNRNPVPALLGTAAPNTVFRSVALAP
jgi:hypothetical protein